MLSINRWVITWVESLVVTLLSVIHIHMYSRKSKYNFLHNTQVENTHIHSSSNQLNCIGNNGEKEEAFDDK